MPASFAAGGRAVKLVLAFATVAAAAPHEVLLPSGFGVLPQAYAPLPPLPPPAVSTHPSLLLRSLNADVPLLLPAAPTPLPLPLPALPVAPALPAAPDHVSPVLRAGAPAILLLPQTSSSGVYHLSDQQHRFPPFLENVVNRVQNLFSSYVQVDPFNTPFGTPRPPTDVPATSAASTAVPASSESGGSTADITTTTTTTTSARTQGRGINLRLTAPGAPGAVGAVPGGLSRDVELLGGRLRQQTSSSGGPDSGPGQPVAFAQATAQVHQQPLGPESEVDSYLPVNNKKDKDKGTAVDERPPPPGNRPGPYGYGRGGRGPSKGKHPHPAGDSYYRRP